MKKKENPGLKIGPGNPLKISIDINIPPPETTTGYPMVAINICIVLYCIMKIGQYD
jgi:hypothetical protein